MAVRYTQKQKDEAVAFVQKYNEENGRGGQSAAVAKYEISPITLSNWLKAAGVKKAPKKKPAARKKATTRKSTGRKSSAKKAASGSSLSDVLNRMASIQQEIESLQSEFDALKSRL